MAERLSNKLICLKEAQTIQVDWKKQSPAELPRKDTPQPVNCLQVEQGALGPPLTSAVTHAGAGFRDAAVFKSFLVL